MSEELPTENGVPRWVASDVLGVINVFERMLLAMEARLVAKMDDNSRLATERWAAHDRDLEANTKRIVERFARIEADFIELEKELREHLRKEEREDIAAEARVKPLKGMVAWFWRNWRDVVLLLIGIVAASTFIIDAVGHFTSGTP